jgi:hypothetical protein
MYRPLHSYVAFPWHLIRRGDRRDLLPWLHSLAPQPLRPVQPWLVFAAIRALAAVDLRGAQIVEYGSGASTRYWLQRGAHLISIEHDPHWYARVRRTISSNALLDYRLVPPVPAPPADPADPAAYASAALPGYSFQHYVQQIDPLPDASLDLVLVDGRARSACVAHAIPKLRPGGLLILDNADRAYYTAQLGTALAAFSAQHYTGAIPGAPVFSQTTFYWRSR